MSTISETPDYDFVPDELSEAEIDALMRDARAHRPVFHWPRYDFWVVTRYEDVLHVLHDHETFSNANSYSEIAQDFLIAKDPPRHTEMRRQLNRVFTPRRVAEQEPEIRRLATEFIDQFPRGEVFDFVELLAGPLQVLVLFRMMNLPDEDLPQLREWVFDLRRIVSPHLSPEERRDAAKSVAELDRYVGELIESRRRKPTDDFYSDLIADVDDGKVDWSDAELRAVINPGLIFAGLTTTKNVMTFTMHRLLTEPGAWEMVGRDRTLLAPAIEESMRLSPPMFAFMRTATRALEVGGVTIPEGATVVWSPFSANRDDQVFACPGQFQVDRASEAFHLSFGHGAHFCLGAALARLTLLVAFELLLDRYPDIRVADGFTPHVTQGPIGRDCDRLELIVPG